MAAVAPPGPTQAPPPQNDIPGALSTISWEGDKMFNIYIYDYCFKRGFRKTARELLLEAEIAPDATPPIDARQGLLFEWWSVFWVLFQAKSGGGSDDALVYTQHQAQRLASQRLQPPSALSSASIPPGSQPAQPPLPSQQQQGQQPPQQMGRFVNGIPRPGSTYLTNGPAPNGILTGMPQLQPGVSFSVGPPSLPSTQPQQPNGVPGGPGGSQQPPPPSGGINPGNQPMQFTSLMPGQPQRQPPPLMNGHPQQQQPQQRGPTNNGPFQSPTMAHSPQNNAGTPGHSGQPGPSNQPQQGQQQGQPSMGQFGGPSPNMAHAHMSRTGMLPPNGGLPAMNPMGPGQQQQQLPQQSGAPPTPGYPQQQQQQGGGRPPSRTNTPGGMMHSSPSLAPRQPPPDGMGGGAVTENNINAEIMRIPQMVMNSLKREIGLGEKDFSTLTMTEKNRILYAHRNRSGPPPGNRNPNQKPGQQDNNAAAGPSTGIMQAPGQQGQRGPQQPQHPQPRIKRNSTSPGEEHETLPRNESSPPERKRIRRSPAEQQSTMQTISYPHHPQQQQGQGQQGQQPPQQQQQNLPQQPQNQSGQTAQLQMHHQQQIMMMRNEALNGPIGPPPLTGPVTQPQIGPGATPLINNPLMMHGTHGMHAMYRQRMNAANPQVGQPVFNPTGPPGVSGGPGGPQFTPGGLNRMTQNKPGIGGSMMPPPSPGMNGAPKDNNGVNGKDAGGNKGLGPSGNNNPGSPRNQPPPNTGGGGGGGTAPPTPVPGPQPNPQQQQQQQQQLGNQNSLNPTPPTMMGVVPNPGPGGGLAGGGSGGLGGPQPDLNTMFGAEFMNNMTSTMDDFTGADLFRPTGPDGDINFERDFGQWFINPDEVGSGLDMK